MTCICMGHSSGRQVFMMGKDPLALDRAGSYAHHTLNKTGGRITGHAPPLPAQVGRGRAKGCHGRPLEDPCARSRGHVAPAGAPLRVCLGGGRGAWPTGEERSSTLPGGLQQAHYSILQQFMIHLVNEHLKMIRA